MPEQNKLPASPATWRRREDILDAFEAAWMRGEQPNLEDYLPAEEPDRSAVLVELVRVDIERRRTAGLAVPDYGQRYPQLLEFKHQLTAGNPPGAEPASQGVVQETTRSSHMDPLSPSAPTPAAPLKRTAAAPALARVPETLGRYRVLAPLATGNFGQLFKGYDEKLRREVAIKIARPDRVPTPKDIEAYLVEAQVLAELDHPGIVPVYDVGRTPDEVWYVVSKLVTGQSLAALLQSGTLARTQAVAIVAAVAEALHHAHRRGVIHRDVKPANIMLDDRGQPVLVDFGLALREADFGHGPVLAGTPAYMSPEQARGEGHRVDARTDIYSLGVVFYQLLTRQMPFAGKDISELLEAVKKQEPFAPRPRDDTIPRELDRICLKAMAKRVTDRYSTAIDLAEDLRHWQDSKPAAAASAETPSIPTPPSSVVPLKVMPKGLRSFDTLDADFFLELIPGPRDRNGLPDSLRFWKARIEGTDPEHTFSVGLLYGPSGCGKSSFVKAGLLPRLNGDILSVYVEATADETESRLLARLRQRRADLPPGLDLTDTLARLRHQLALDGKKVLIVLDQFEQWLHAHPHEEHATLTQALRQCDGEHIQCLILVRDDFWMATTRFMHELEVRVLEGANAAAVDLFDRRHARKVLEAFGRAFNALPEASSQRTKEQDLFLDQAVASLTQDGQVICVRLALFSEMVKGLPWTPATLEEVGGTEGVGVAFLDKTFTAQTALPQHRLHQKAAQRVLKALLPDVGRISSASHAGTDIKGHMKSRQELLEASGYAHRPRDFDDLLRILDGELRLITPTDPQGILESENVTAPSPADGKYYQLTHDYLALALREWLTRTQKETRRGRAEFLLADRASVWNARPEHNQLPSLLQWFAIHLWTRKKDWTPPQRKMMSQANRYHVIRGLVVVALLAAGLLVGLNIRSQVKEQQQTTRAAGLVSQLVDAQIDNVPEIIKQIEPYRLWAAPYLNEEYARAEVDSRQRLHASLALLPVDPEQVKYLSRRLLDAEPHEVRVIRDALLPHKDELLDKLWNVVKNPEKGKEYQRLRAAYALARFDPQSSQWNESSGLVVADLVSVNPVYLGRWSEGFRPVQTRLLTPLAAVFRERTPARAAARALATNLLADFAAEEPHFLADLLMDADEQQFTLLFPKLLAHQERCLPLLEKELKKQVAMQTVRVFEDESTDPPQGISVKMIGMTGVTSSLPARVYLVNMKKGRTYRMTMTSDGLETFLVLQDSGGRQLVATDPGGGKTAVLHFTASSDGMYKLYAASPRGTGGYAIEVVVIDAREDAKESLAKRQANAAVMLLRMGQAENVWPLLKHSPDPRLRSYLIHWLAPRGAERAILVKKLADEPDLTSRRALILSLGAFAEKDWPPAERNAFMKQMQELYQTASDPGLHATAEWLLRSWHQEEWLGQVNQQWKEDAIQREKRLAAIQRELRKDPDRAKPQWYVNGEGQTLVVIPQPHKPFMMGSRHTEVKRFDWESQHLKRITRSFAIAAKPVTVDEYRRFDKSYTFPERFAPTGDCPVINTTWYEAAAYCNWLSEQENLTKCYAVDEKGNVTHLKENYLSLTGYRLPTEAEWEYACRAGSVTIRYYGEKEELLTHYGWYLANSEERSWPVGGKKPNDVGLFDMYGNVWQWCQERYTPYPQAAGERVFEDKEDVLKVTTHEPRSSRGGSFYNPAQSVRSSIRLMLAPPARFFFVGFRVARSFPTK